MSNHQRFLDLFKPAVLTESVLTETVAYHVSTENISNVNSNPMFLFKSQKISNALLRAFKDERDEGYQYSADITGNVLSLAGLKKLLKDDWEDYVADMVSNPTVNEIMNNDSTKAIISAGYVGVELLDYHPADPQKDAKSLLIFNARKTLSNFKKLR